LKEMIFMFGVLMSFLFVAYWTRNPRWMQVRGL